VRSALRPACALLLAAACSRGPLYEGRGVVRDLEPREGQVLVEHEDIPGLMPAMTMSFEVADRRLLEGLAVGQRIEFRLLADGRRYRIVELRAAGEGRASEPGLRFGAVAPESEAAPPFALIDQDGHPLALADLAGNAVLLDFVYTRCPGPCPILTGVHVEAQRALSPQLRARSRFVSISLDPERDRPPELAAYARARGADLSQWSFLTGEPARVREVLGAYGVGATPGPDGELQHVVATFVIDGSGRITRRFLGLDHTAEEVVQALEQAIAAGPGAGAARRHPPFARLRLAARACGACVLP
jgi:protein SCO1/2